ncbi:mRNA cleavage and polyadenylation specificity factor complex, WD repeat protein Pfs2 [Schizosaccharomyces osmophilus]|uniref:Polyadenylation factor subunit 2 n=1 Tax=Schizosaccharomyces osmophilus TaxID=2545709 RepID=A0AAE9WFJ7_9SCHI|nr:mRNA cleavage and polyadenylation specificity factor complex, WD repeat protein Pfs2 [Schizosaccharomyces osmophilus]WBW73853.1 mRNA cleavage and polyadenylation specificity factor complex, WD repeat protein Pfs2 [Schizosaccharomyces osmophilus]
MERAENARIIQKPMTRRTVDYGSNLSQYVLNRHLRSNMYHVHVPRPNPNHILNQYPPCEYKYNYANSLCTKYIHTSANKARHVINVVRWTPDGRRLLTGSSTGEFTLWNGLTFNFELINQSHDYAVRCAEWSSDGRWLISGDGGGIIKYFEPNLNNVKILQAHEMEIRDVAFSPNDSKFVTASDDGSLKIWNFQMSTEEQKLTGHGWDVKTVDWHPSKGLLASGSKDNLVKFWDPRTASCLATLHGHKNTIMQASFQNGFGNNYLATVSRDSTCRIFDLRVMKDIRVLRGHEKDINCVTWHPIHGNLLTTGGSDGSVNHYSLDEPPVYSQQKYHEKHPQTTLSSSSHLLYPTAEIPYAHELGIWSMQYHPLGHLLCTGSNDKTTRFWSRSRPDDEESFLDRHHLGEEQSEAVIGQRRAVAEEEDAYEPDEISPMENLSNVNKPYPSMPTLPGLGNAPGFAPSAAAAASSANPQIPGMTHASTQNYGNPSPSTGPFIPGLGSRHQDPYSQSYR